MGLFDEVSRRLRGGDKKLAESPLVVSRRTKEIGAPGVENFSGYITQDFNDLFNGDQATEIFDKMRKSDATVQATLKAVKLPIMSAEYTVESADSNDSKQNDIAEFIRINLFKNLEGGFASFWREALGHLDFGHYPFEKVYEVRDGQVWLKKLAPRLPTTIQKWTIAGDKPGITQLLPSVDKNDKNQSSNREIPMEKLVLFVNEKEGNNYQGVSILRSAYKHWYMKDALYRIDAIKHERGAGILHIGLPAGSSAEDRANAEELGEFFKVNEKSHIVTPSPEWKLEMITNGISDQSAALMESVKHHDRQIMVNILAQFLDLGSGSGGSYSLSQDQSSFFTLANRAIANYMTEVINKEVVKELVILNFGAQEEYPRLTAQGIGEIDYDEMSQVLERLTNAGLVKNDAQFKVWIAKTFGFPMVTVEDFEDDDDDDMPAPPAEPEEEDEPQDDDMAPDVDEEEIERELAERQYFRPLTYAEERVELAEVDDFFKKNEQEVEQVLADATEEQKQKLLKQAEKLLDSGEIAAVTGVSAALTASTVATLRNKVKESLEEGKKQAAREVDAEIPVTKSGKKKAVNTKLDLMLRRRQRALEAAVQERLLTLMSNGVGKPASMAELERVIDDVTSKQNKQIAGQVVVDSFDEGRNIVFENKRADLHGLQRSEVLDQKTCNVCLSLDGRVLSPNDPFTNIGQVHTHCRGIWVAVLKTDAELPTVKQLPKTLKNRFETIEGVPNTNNFKQMKQPIVRKGSRVDQKIKDGDLEV